MFIRRHLRQLKPRGFTLAELLIVVSLSLVIAVGAGLVVMVQIGKAQDARRKADLDALKTSFESYFNDFGRFPQPGDLPACGEGFDKYLKAWPCDPTSKQPYAYLMGQFWFKIYTRLNRGKDPVISQVGCQNGCGPGNAYNYGVSSDNVTVGSGVTEEGVQPECGGPGKWFCFANICAECCPGSNYRCNGSSTRCILDATCGN